MSTLSKFIDDEDEKQALQTPTVALITLKWILVLILMVAGGLVGAYAYILGYTFEKRAFETQYFQTVELLERRITDSLQSKVQAASALGQLFDDFAWSPSRDAAFPSFARFDETVTHLLPSALSRSMAYAPYIQNMTQRSEVETWANNEVVPSFNMTTAKKYGPAYNGTQASWSNTSLAYGAHTFGVYRRVNVTLKRTSPPVPSAVNASDPLAPSYPLNFYAPVLYISPLEDPQQGDNWPAILFDLNSEAERRAAIARVLAQGACSTTGIIYLVQDTVRVPPLFRAAGLTFCPVQAGGAVNGFVTAVFNWDKMLENAVPTFLSGLVVVLEAPDAQGAAVSHSFVVRGRSVADLGKGAQFDPKFTKYKRTFTMVQGLQFTMSCYPSDELSNAYYSSDPRARCVVVVCVMFGAIAIFVIYDWIARSQKKMLTGIAKAASKLVDDIFPKNVKQRVVKAQMDKALPQDEAHGDVEGVLRSNRSSLEPAKGRGFLPLLLAPRGAARGARPSASSPLAPATLGPAIADYYPSSTVLFSDIVGFTAWSATVQPETVFHLLEVMFFEFDRLADKLNVYKVETIGDAYMCVTGCPEPDPEHAVRMADFALGMVEAMESIKRQTGVPHLQIRIGVHSGPVVAGVIRSAKMRFQLFGDTVNYASRMESTSEPGCVQVSEATAEALRTFGHHVLEARGVVEAKGKGLVTTHWLRGRVGGMEPCWGGAEARAVAERSAAKSGSLIKAGSLIRAGSQIKAGSSTLRSVSGFLQTFKRANGRSSYFSQSPGKSFKNNRVASTGAALRPEEDLEGGSATVRVAPVRP